MKIIFDIEALVDCCAIYHVGFADVLGMRHSHRGLDEYRSAQRAVDIQARAPNDQPCSCRVV
jgi:hypothetical protein